MNYSICGICGFPKTDPTQGMGYAGNLCTGHEPFRAPALTEDDIRRIVREELIRSRVLADRSNDI
jgi:hypothetical protein